MKEEITIEDFGKIDFRVGEVRVVRDVEGSGHIYIPSMRIFQWGVF